ncbi:MAG TPA: hypothetical protein VMS73_01430 [Anaerolineaceae bacterium]|nr:hypothetical protein [Anaerolineaceae bacterium]
MKKLALLCVIMVMISGCAPLTIDQNANAAVSSGNILFKDDFSDPTSGWETWSEPSGSMVAYQNGGLRIYIAEKQFDYWSRPGKRVSDVYMEADVIKLGGPDDNDFGFICRYQDRDNFYALLASSDGYAGILKVKDGNYHIISGAEMAYSESIRKGGTQNHLRADCNGADLSLSANGQKILDVQDQDFKTGEIGLIAGTGDTGGADLYFDNFLAYKP